MRVISGLVGGRSLKSVPGQQTRPTTDKVKEALFSMIGPYFDGGAVLDLFAGTGGLGIEALSRGCERAVFVDRQPIAVHTIKANLSATGFTDRAEVYRNDAERALKALQKRALRFELAFLDPPYHLDIIPRLLEQLQGFDVLFPSALVVCEHSVDRPLPQQIGSLVIRRSNEYGDTAVTIYANEKGA